MTYAEWAARWNIPRVGVVGDGWVPLLERMMQDLTALRWNGTFRQIKEKFGGLRVYTEGETPVQYERILAAERESYRTCEQCGATGDGVRQSTRGWIKTLCEPCHGARYRNEPPINDP